MKNTVTIKINNESHQLKFGYGVIRNVSEIYNLKGFNQFGEFVQNLGFGEKDNELTFEQIDFLGRLILNALPFEVQSDLKYDINVLVDEVVLRQPETLPFILEAFTNSFPGNQGKKKVARTSPKKATKKVVK